MHIPARVSIFLTAGMLIVGLAVFAKQFGLDPNPGWGKGRLALLVFGMLVAVTPWIAGRWSKDTDIAQQSDLFTFPVLLLVIAVYLWFITVSHDATSNYYSLLATSFRSGELSLPLKPDPALLALDDPYDPAERQGVKFPVDLSLYNGKFYLYWGPAPAALLAVVQRFLPARLGEVDLLFLFMCGIFLAQYLLIMFLWEKFFWKIPRWILLLSILIAGFANPVLWMLSQPKIYEAAIAGAQFFFIAGFVAAVLALDRRFPSGWLLLLAGMLWALAVTTRTVAVFPILFMTVMIVYWVFLHQRQPILQGIRALVPLGLPLLLGALGFVLYNWARFGSLMETGFTYQLAAPHLQQHMDDLFSPGYILQNLYNYLLHPYAIEPAFPFLDPTRGRVADLLSWQILPEFYTAQAITGYLCAVPFLVFALIPITRLVQKSRRNNRAEEHPPRLGSVSLSWITISLLGSFALPFISLLAFFWAAMRYAEDFMPALILLSILGFWQGYQSLARGDNGKMYAAVGVTLAGISIASAVLLALSIYYSSGLL
jgi:hypothetical protein